MVYRSGKVVQLQTSALQNCSKVGTTSEIESSYNSGNRIHHDSVHMFWLEAAVIVGLAALSVIHIRFANAIPKRATDWNRTERMH